jgi:ABC-type glycerol-3-phosphate transport system substrate-binding protein
VRHRVTTPGLKRALAVAVGVAALGAGACGGGDSASPAPAPTTAAQAAPAAAPATSSSAPRCRKVPGRTVRLIASHANPATRFNARVAAAVKAGSGYAVSLVALAGGTERMATWFVDDLRAPQVVTSSNVQALRITDWPLDSLAPEVARQSGICAAKRLRGPVR